ncbi:MAG: VanZ family protein [Treponema sp.]|jgi:VanZ family protein|nr:VanZ family protein [Treponema sp.]
MVRKIVFRLPALLIFGGIWWLSSQTILPQPKGVLGFDKVQHLIAYAALSMSLGLWFSGKQWKNNARGTMLLLFSIASIYGIIDEVHQYFVPGRDCNVWDWAADVLGAILGALGAVCIAGKICQHDD